MLGAQAREIGRAQSLDIVEVALPAGIVRPALRRLHGRARRRCALQHMEREVERRGLRGRIVRLAGGVAEREVAEQEARHAGMFHDVLGAAHDHGRDAGGLEMARDEADGLVADRAVRHQHRGIDLVRAHEGEDVRRVLLQRAALAARGRCAVEARRHAADAAFGSGALQLREREPAVGILGGGVGAVVGDVGDAHVGIALDRMRIGAVELGRRVVGRARPLVAERGIVERGRRHQADAAFLQRLAQRREGHVGKMRPAIGLVVAERR